ncbi:MAG: molybdopterin-binding/glycosyltransferase family 2 protein [Pseudomonadota bacterium]
MYFGPVPVAVATGAILAHSVRAGDRSLKKGRWLTAEDVALLDAGGVEEVIVARLDAGDVHEDAAAERMGSRLAGSGLTAKAPFTGRVNLFAAHDGILTFDPDAVLALNSVDESMTLATLAPWSWVKQRQMIATIKIIPFAVPGEALAAALELADDARVAVTPLAPLPTVLIQTELAATRSSVLDKTVRVLTQRVEALGGELVAERRVPHTASAVAQAIDEIAGNSKLVLVAGASAIVDRRDVVPAGITAAGGQVRHFGMPVDPGNLILLAERNGIPVLGLPSCARSPALNGVDLVLQRIAAGIHVEPRDVMAMGVGGLLKEFAGRPTPRAGKTPEDVVKAPDLAAVVLAAGQSRRMGQRNKLLIEVDGQPMVAHAVRAAAEAGLAPIVVVTGHERERIEAALAGDRVQFCHNPDYAQGLSTSLAKGLRALGDDCDGALVCLGDMPRVGARVMDRLSAAYDPVEGRAICVPTWHGKRGNPVLWDRRFFAQMAEVEGDVGARHLLGMHQAMVCEVAMEDAAVLLDIDSPAELATLDEVDR